MAAPLRLTAVLALVAATLTFAACGGEGDGAAARDPGIEDAADGDAPTGDPGAADAADADAPADGAPPSDASDPAAVLLSVAEAEQWSLAGLAAPAYVLRTAGHVPHVYAADRIDAARVLGFTLARDRYFILDLARRLSRGRVSALLGDLALETDVESHLIGMVHVSGRIAAHLGDLHGRLFDAYAEGINAYIDAARAGDVPPPTELSIAGPLLGAASPTDLMEPFDRQDVASLFVALMYESSFHADDPGRQEGLDALDGHFAGVAHEALRTAGLEQDIWLRVRPIKARISAAGLGVEGPDGLNAGPTPDQIPGARAAAPRRDARGGAASAASALRAMTTRLAARMARRGRLLGRDATEGFGSNCWSVAGRHTADGNALLAGDGHLPLDIPALFYQVGLDTAALGGEDLTQAGLLIVGLPLLAVGTNGHVAWSSTQLTGDTDDWYAEQLELGPDGLPARSRFDGAWRDLVRHDEPIEVADVPALQSVGRTESLTRWTTFDGRWIAEVEGRTLADDEAPADGEAVVRLPTGRVVPGDADGDGVVRAISFDFSGLDTTRIVEGYDQFGLARSVDDFREATKKVAAASQNYAIADSTGAVGFSVYQPTPCRGYLPRDADGRFLPGANPMFLLDGTRYGAFEIPSLDDGTPDYGAGAADPQRCVIPFEATPQSSDPASGIVVNANNDPGNFTIDDDLFDDAWYIGGPWDTGFRADFIHRGLDAAIADGGATVDDMASVQADHRSGLGETFVPFLLEAIELAQALSARSAESLPHERRLRDAYLPSADRIDEVATRLAGWSDRGFEAASGVETFYHQPTDDDREDAVATMIFNAWIGRFVHAVWGDEQIHGGLFLRGDQRRVELIVSYLVARDAGIGGGHGAHNPETNEAIFFDRLGTDEVERSRELMITALVAALDWLSSETERPGVGGFGTDDMSAWLWGLRHQVRFQSMLGSFLDDPRLNALLRAFDLDTSKLPLADAIPSDDPRKGLRWFPRPGDQWGVDAANPGLSGTSFTHGSGPVMRMAISIGPAGVSGLNVLPGGQSALTTSPHFSDQAALWLANEALPIHFGVEAVAANATSRETFTPAP